MRYLWILLLMGTTALAQREDITFKNGNGCKLREIIYSDGNFITRLRATRDHVYRSSQISLKDCIAKAQALVGQRKKDVRFVAHHHSHFGGPRYRVITMDGTIAKVRMRFETDEDLVKKTYPKDAASGNDDDEVPGSEAAAH